MAFRFLKIFLFSFFLILCAAVSSAQAQEEVSGIEEDEIAQPENIIVVEVDDFQSEALKKFLRDYRKILQESKLNVSDTLKKHREEYAGIKQENLRVLKQVRRNKLPKVVFKKINPEKDLVQKPFPITPKPALFPLPQNYRRENQFDESRAPKKEVTRLSLDERQHLASIQSERSKKTLRSRQSEMGRLKSAIEKNPLKDHQTKLAGFSDEIKKILKQIRNGQRGKRELFLELGNAYLESQRYLNALDSKDRLKLSSYAPHAGVALGSYELALWTYKMALTLRPNDGDTNLLMGKVYAEMGIKDRALERARNAEQLFSKSNEQEKASQSRRLIDSLANSSLQKQ